jgi:hypothetical protein
VGRRADGSRQPVQHTRYQSNNRKPTNDGDRKRRGGGRDGGRARDGDGRKDYEKRRVVHAGGVRERGGFSAVWLCEWRIWEKTASEELFLIFLMVTATISLRFEKHESAKSIWNK